jgi:hypothetical protein
MSATLVSCVLLNYLYGFNAEMEMMTQDKIFMPFVRNKLNMWSIAHQEDKRDVTHASFAFKPKLRSHLE